MATSKDYSRSIIAASDEVQDILCEPCEQDGRKTEAEGYCVDCPEYLCGQCYKNHKLYKAFRNHVLQDRDNMPQTVTGVSVKDVCVQKCSKHPDEVIKYFCGSCDSLGCSTCMILDHRQCKIVDDIPKLVTSQETQEEFQTFIKKVDKMTNQIKESRNAIRSISNIADNLQPVARTELEKHYDEINKFIENLKTKMYKKIEEIDRSNGDMLAAALKKYDSIDKELINIKNDVDKGKKDRQNCEEFIAMKLSALDMKRFETELRTLQTESKILKYEILPSLKIQEMFRNINEICRLDTETIQPLKEESVHITTDKELTQNTRQETEVSRGSPLKTLRKESEFNVGSINHAKIYVRGLTVIHGHFIVVADNKNNLVKVIDARNKAMVSEMTMEGKVWSVTNVKDDEIAVGEDSTIQFLSVSKSGKLSKIYAIGTERTSFDLAYINGKLITAQSGGTVQITDTQGKILKTFKHDSMGKKLFSSCYGLALSPDNKTIYVSDCSHNTVISMTFEGKVKAIYQDKDLLYPWGITTDNEGNVYVCSTGTDSIHLLSADCKKLQIFPNVAGGSVTYSNANRLIVGGSPNIKIYDIL